MTLKRIKFLLLILVLTLIYFCKFLNNVYAETITTPSAVSVSNQTTQTSINNQTEQINNNVEPTTIDVKIPSVNTFTFNPNTESFDLQNININNNSNVPVYLNINNITVESNSLWKPYLVSPTSHNDIGWNNLTQDQSEKEISLGISVVDNDNWINISDKNIWSTDIGSKSNLGIIQYNSSVNVKPIIKCGTSINNTEVLTAKYIFEFGLA